MNKAVMAITQFCDAYVLEGFIASQFSPTVQ